MLIAAFFALFFRSQSVKYKAAEKSQAQRADSAEEMNALNQRISNNTQKLEARHRQEQMDEKTRFDAGDRNQFDNNGL